MTTDEITAEAADKISNALNSKVAVARKAQLIAIIKSAIEKAQQDDTKRLDWLSSSKSFYYRNGGMMAFGGNDDYDLRRDIDAAMRKETKP